MPSKPSRTVGDGQALRFLVQAGRLSETAVRTPCHSIVQLIALRTADCIARLAVRGEW